MGTKDRLKLPTGVGLQRGAAYVHTTADEQQNGWAENQVQRIIEWAVRQRSQVNEWFVDLGVESCITLSERAGGAQLIEAVRRGEVGFVVVTTYDQLGRFPEAVLETIQELVRLEALVIVVDARMSPELRLAIGPVESLELKPGVEQGSHDCSEQTLN